MVSVQVKPPGGFGVEHGCAGPTVDEATWVAGGFTAVAYRGRNLGGG